MGEEECGAGAGSEEAAEEIKRRSHGRSCTSRLSWVRHCLRGARTNWVMRRMLESGRSIPSFPPTPTHEQG